MDVRERLVKLINHVSEGHVVNLMQPGGAEELADYLIANGVTVREPQKPLTVEAMKELWGKSAIQKLFGSKIARE